MTTKKKLSMKKILLISSISLFTILIGLLVYDYINILPQNVKVTNVTSSSMTVSWTTKNRTKGVAKVVEGQSALPVHILGQDVSYDNRDVKEAELLAVIHTQENISSDNTFGVSFSNFAENIGLIKSTKYYTHHVTLTGLNPDSDYEIFVGDGVIYSRAQESKNKTFSTVDVPKSIPSPYPTYGTVLDANNMDIPVDDLLPVNDAIVYFTFFEDVNNNRSNTYSSTMNDEGNWYLDVSGARTSDGEDFFDKYSQLPVNIMAEIVVDTGNSGIWKKVINANEISPVQTMVLNIPNSVNDANINGNALEKISSQKITEMFVPDVLADDGYGIFAGFCGPCTIQKDGVWVSAPCDPGILDSRNCEGQPVKDLETQLQDNYKNDKPVCSEGSYSLYGGNCKICVKAEDRALTYWSDLDDDSICEEKGVGEGQIKVDTGRGKELEEGESIEKSSEKTDTMEKVAKTELTLEEIVILDDCYEAGFLVDAIINYNGDSYKCSSSGRWEKKIIPAQCDRYCNPLHTGDVCISEDSSGNVVEKRCFGTLWVESSSGSSNGPSNEMPLVAVKVENISEGEQCPDTESMCRCSGGTKDGKVVTPGEFCPERVGISCFVGDHLDGEICSTSGFVCSGGKCVENTDSIKSSDKKSSGIVGEGFVGEVLAQEDSAVYADYILDPENGYISGLSAGTYTFEWNGETYAFRVIEEQIEANNGELDIYIDVNNNQMYDSEDEKLTKYGSQIKISTSVRTYDYNLRTGYNFISTPFLVSNPNTRTAASLLDTLNKQYIDAFYSISKFDGTWKAVGQSSILYDTNDFQLVPGEGYVIYAKEDIDISIIGQPVKFDETGDSAPVLFNLGWNLVGLYGSGIRNYTAESLLDGLNSYQEIDFTADNVSKWDEEVQMYEGLQKTYENGTPAVYGFDFPLQTQKAYFVRVLEGSGNWNPELK